MQSSIGHSGGDYELALVMSKIKYKHIIYGKK